MAAGRSSNTTRHLVVCGVTGTRCSWLSGDFLGFITALKDQGIHEIFINCFDLDGYFEQGKFTDIKFGKREEVGEGDRESGDHIAIYSRWDWEHRTPWWIQLNSVASKVLEWVRKQAADTKPKDIVYNPHRAWQSTWYHTWWNRLPSSRSRSCMFFLPS